jgi:hypothetical protein
VLNSIFGGLPCESRRTFTDGRAAHPEPVGLDGTFYLRLELLLLNIKHLALIETGTL